MEGETRDERKSVKWEDLDGEAAPPPQPTAKERAIQITIRRAQQNTPGYRPPRPPRKASLPIPMESVKCQLCEQTARKIAYDIHLQKCVVAERADPSYVIPPTEPIAVFIEPTPGKVHAPPVKTQSYFIPMVSKRLAKGESLRLQSRDKVKQQGNTLTASAPVGQHARIVKCPLCKEKVIDFDRHVRTCLSRQRSPDMPLVLMMATAKARFVTVPFSTVPPPKLPNSATKDIVCMRNMDAPKSLTDTQGDGAEESTDARRTSQQNPLKKFIDLERAAPSVSSCPSLTPSDKKPKNSPKPSSMRRLSNTIRRDIALAGKKRNDDMPTFVSEYRMDPASALEVVQEHSNLRFMPAAALIKEGTTVALYCFEKKAFMRMTADGTMMVDSPMASEAMSDTHFAFKLHKDMRVQFKSEMWGKSAWKKEDTVYMFSNVLFTRGKKQGVRTLHVDESGVATFPAGESESVEYSVHVFPLS